MIKRLLLTTSLTLALVACGQETDTRDITPADEPAAETATEAPAEEMQEPAATSDEMDDAEMRAALEEAVSSEYRSEGNPARDDFRNPVETILFFGIEPDDTVVEIWPGRGWYTEILGQYLNSGGGKLYAAGFPPSSENPRVQQALSYFDETFVQNPDVYGDVEMTVLSQDEQAIAPDGTADVVVTFRNVHNFEIGGWSEDAFAAFYAALKPGGTLGVVDHRLPEDSDKAMEKSSGYVKESTVRQLAENAGFVFDGAAEINANPMDTADHPFGVWTLPPTSRTTDRNGETPEGFDAENYKAIGESDRMTLRFKKPIEPTEPLLE